MADYPRYTINRHLVILMPKQPVLDWIVRMDPMPPTRLTLEEVRHEQNAFLVPDSLDGQQDAERWVYRRWSMFFESFLNEWYTAEDLWPQKRTLKMFKEWFDVQYHSMVWDMAPSEPLGYEDWDDLGDVIELH